VVAAGIAGHYQWGLDAGGHQDWNTYASMQDLNHGDRAGSDAELEVKHLTLSPRCFVSLKTEYIQL